MSAARAGDVAAEHADGLRQRADLNVDAAVQTEVIDRAAARRPEHAAGMGVVDHHDAAEFVGDVAESGQRAEVAVHAEHAVGDEQRAPMRAAAARRISSRGVDVAVRKHLDRRATETRAVDDAGVIQFVGDDRVLAAEHRGDGAGVGGESALEHDGRLGLLERGQPAARARRAASIVPAIVRTAPDPTPYRSTASSARARSRGCVVRPR